jgi:hypothetical protein
MAVGIGNMEEALAPFRIARRRLDPVPGGGQPGIEPVHIRVVEDHAAPRTFEMLNAAVAGFGLAYVPEDVANRISRRAG